MRAQPLGATLSISIDLRPDPVRANHGSTEAFYRTAKRLIELLTASEWPVTWASADPAGCELIARAMQSAAGHEAALLVDQGWMASDEGRSRLMAEIMPRIARARAGGLPITTLVLTEPAADLPLDLLSKYGITAIRGPIGSQAANKRGSAGPQPLRFGLWQFESDARLSGGAPLGEWFAAARIRRAIERRARAGAPFHLTIDVAALAIHSSAERLGGMAGLVHPMARRQRDGAPRIETIAQTVARLSAPSAPRAATSILRAA